MKKRWRGNESSTEETRRGRRRDERKGTEMRCHPKVPTCVLTKRKETRDGERDRQGERRMKTKTKK